MDISAELKDLVTCFIPYGSVELHGCETGKGSKGSRLLQELADLWGVPVAAGTEKQVSGGIGTSTFRLEGKKQKPVFKTPCNIGLSVWAKSVLQRGR